MHLVSKSATVMHHCVIPLCAIMRLVSKSFHHVFIHHMHHCVITACTSLCLSNAAGSCPVPPECNIHLFPDEGLLQTTICRQCEFYSYMMFIRQEDMDEGGPKIPAYLDTLRDGILLLASYVSRLARSSIVWELLPPPPPQQLQLPPPPPPPQAAPVNEGP